MIVACALTELTADDAMTGISLVDEVDGHLTRVTADPADDTLAFYGAAGAAGRRRPAPISRRGWRMRAFGTHRFSGIGVAPGPEAGEWPSPW